MPRSLAVLVAMLLCLFIRLGPARAADEPSLSVAIDDFTYVDTSGEPTDQSAAHHERLHAFMTALRRDVAAEGRIRVDAKGEPAVRIIGVIQKLSTLVQWARVAAVAEGTRRVLFEKLYTFRGDDEQAWQHAEAFLSRDILAALAEASPVATATAAPVGVAVFDFELEDMTAAASAGGITASDAARLDEVTGGVRRLLAQSGRYRVVDTAAADADAVKTRSLRDCGGCDAAIAAKLGADQSLIGVVRRVSRTEYTVGFQVRDTRTGAVTSRGDSGLRMGADYSWSRGAVRLIEDRLLEGQSGQQSTKADGAR